MSEDPTADHAAMIRSMHAGTWAAELGLVLDTATRDEVTGHVVVRPEHRQPMGIVHGGVYASMVESLASIGAGIDSMARGKHVVGLDNHTSFIRAVREGTLRGRATPVTRGRRTQLWDVRIADDDGKTIATGRVRLLALDADAEVAGGPLGAG